MEGRLERVRRGFWLNVFCGEIFVEAHSVLGLKNMVTTNNTPKRDSLHYNGFGEAFMKECDADLDKDFHGRKRGKSCREGIAQGVRGNE